MYYIDRYILTEGNASWPGNVSGISSLSSDKEDASKFVLSCIVSVSIG